MDRCPIQRPPSRTSPAPGVGEVQPRYRSYTEAGTGRRPSRLARRCDRGAAAVVYPVRGCIRGTAVACGAPVRDPRPLAERRPETLFRTIAMSPNHRVHACLDGEIPREALTPAERAELAALEATLGEAAGALRAAPAPDLVARVMASLPEASAAAPSRREPAPWQGFMEWLWRPRSFTIQLRPAYALAGCAAAVLAVVYLPRQVEIGGQPAVVAEAVRPGGAARLYVQFRLEAPQASQVTLAGSFTGWQPEYELRETAPGVWSALVPLEPGVHDYTFVVDGEQWVPDPYAPQVDDSFGGTNSRLFLPTPIPEGRA
jgi:hypothetical protein